MKNSSKLRHEYVSWLPYILVNRSFIAATAEANSKCTMQPVSVSTWWLFIYAFIGFGWFGASPVLCAADSVLKTLPDHIPMAVTHLSAIGTLPPTNRLNLSIGLQLRD